jgi:EAL and modified HD-GYP domain-containing signal transduction protein
LLPYADYAKIDVQALGQQDRRNVCGHFRRKGLTMLAEKVETRADFDWALKDGCELFQGYFFAKPEILSFRQVPTSKLACLRLVSEIQKEGLDFARLENLVKCDEGLIRMLLCFANSAAFSAGNPVKTVKQALLRLGEEKIRQWVTLAALPALADGRPGELITAALTRARFCELVAEKTGQADRASSCFLMGLLSLLDAMVGLPMQQLLDDMPLERNISGSILAAPNHEEELRPFLDLARCFERSDFEAASQPAERLGVPIQSASALYPAAMAWSDTIPRCSIGA